MKEIKTWHLCKIICSQTCQIASHAPVVIAIFGNCQDVGKSRSQLFSDLLSAINRQDYLQLKLTLAVSKRLKLEGDLDPRNQELVRHVQEEMRQEKKSLRTGFL